MTSKRAQQFKSRYAKAAFERRDVYRRVFESWEGRFILADLMRGSGMLDVDKNVTPDDAMRSLSRWWPIASILNGMSMTDEQVVEWAVAAAQQRAAELGEADE